MDELSYLFAAYTFIWIILFGYILHLRHRQKSLERDILLLQHRLGIESPQPLSAEEGKAPEAG